MMTGLLANLAAAALLAQNPVIDAEYYKAIQTGAETLEAEAFAQLETDARDDAWVEWQRENPLKPASADFQRSEVRS